MLTGLIMMCAAVSVILTIFLLYHLRMVSQGCTTAEKIKMSQMRYSNGRAVSFLKRWKEFKEKSQSFQPSDASVKQYKVKKNWTIDEIKEELVLR
jgi:hypothetical protein